ncbi:MAG: hypothetical protein ACOCXA_02325 [Planctomycetota bacterium]
MKPTVIVLAVIVLLLLLLWIFTRNEPEDSMAERMADLRERERDVFSRGEEVMAEGRELLRRPVVEAGGDRSADLPPSWEAGVAKASHPDEVVEALYATPDPETLTKRGRAVVLNHLVSELPAMAVLADDEVDPGLILMGTRFSNAARSFLDIASEDERAFAARSLAEYLYDGDVRVRAMALNALVNTNTLSLIINSLDYSKVYEEDFSLFLFHVSQLPDAQSHFEHIRFAVQTSAEIGDQKRASHLRQLDSEMQSTKTGD